MSGPVYHRDLIQGSDEWLAERCGLLTASEMRFIVTPPPKPETRVKKNGEPYKQREWEPCAENDKERAHLWELLSQRISGYVEPQYIGSDMLRGIDDEIEARIQYDKHFARVTECGFITNDKWGFTIGYSPDGLIGTAGAIECKSRRQRFQVETIATGAVPEEYVMQLQTGLLVSEREWIDFVSFSGGLPMFVLRVHPDPVIQAAIIDAAAAFEQRIDEKAREYHAALATMPKLIPTERKIEQEMFHS